MILTPTVVTAAAPASSSWLSEAEWAAAQWGRVALGDPRRTRRALAVGAAMLARPAASIPQQMRSPAATKGAYGMLNNPAVSLAALSQPHWTRTRQTTEAAVVLQLQDTTEVDYTAQPHIQGLGPIGDGRGRGLLLHSVLSVAPSATPDADGVLGVAHQQVVLRQARDPHTPKPKWTRTPESLVWQTAVEALDTPPPGVRWVHVGDRAADNFGLWRACRARRAVDFLVRLKANRVLVEFDPPLAPPLADASAALLDYARGLPAVGASVEVEVAATRQQPARTATVQLSWATVLIEPPTEAPAEVRLGGPIRAWVVRAWEKNPPPAVSDPLEWVLLSSVAVESWTEAVERVGWYRRRWLIEEYHKCLKTGCGLEHTQLDHRADIERLLGFVGPIAARLLQLRQTARQTPTAPAIEVVGRVAVMVVAHQIGVDAATLDLAHFWRGVAQLGGHLGRTHDGPPGWQSLWRGWQEVRLLSQGLRLALGLSQSDMLLLNSS